MEYPKVLIINMTFNTYTGSGITMSNLFGVGKDKILLPLLLL